MIGSHARLEGWTVHPLVIPSRAAILIQFMEIYRHQFPEPKVASEFKITDYISDYHSQDCCESVYIDFEHLDTFRNQIDELWEIVGITINVVTWEWITVFLYSDMDEKTERRMGIFLACRNVQNWYYSDALELVIQEGIRQIRIDLQEVGAVDNSQGND